MGILALFWGLRMAGIGTHGSLFSGIGGFDLASSWMGWRNVFQCEIDESCRRVLNQIALLTSG